MHPGAFSLSLTVNDIKLSRQFYEKCGFSIIGGEQSENWLIMKNSNTVIGLFQDMFPTNIMTFNPGWDQDGNPLESFTDVRTLHQNFKSQGLEIKEAALENESGPGSFMMMDPDGNVLMFDQHI